MTLGNHISGGHIAIGGVCALAAFCAPAVGLRGLPELSLPALIQYALLPCSFFLTLALAFGFVAGIHHLLTALESPCASRRPVWSDKITAARNPYCLNLLLIDVTLGVRRRIPG